MRDMRAIHRGSRAGDRGLCRRARMCSDRAGFRSLRAAKRQSRPGSSGGGRGRFLGGDSTLSPRGWISLREERVSQSRGRDWRGSGLGVRCVGQPWPVQLGASYVTTTPTFPVSFVKRSFRTSRQKCSMRTALLVNPQTASFLLVEGLLPRTLLIQGLKPSVFQRTEKGNYIYAVGCVVRHCVNDSNPNLYSHSKALRGQNGNI